MIMQALCDYYQRKAADPESGIAPEGFEWKPIPFLIVISPEGHFVDLQDTREGEGKKKQARAFLVPKDVGRSGNAVRANLLWDNVEYAIGANPRGRKDVAERHRAFCERIQALPDHPELNALKRFLGAGALKSIEASRKDILLWKDMVETNSNVSFRVTGSDHSAIFESVSNLIADAVPASSVQGRCLVTGALHPVARTHPKIKGVWNAQTAGASLVSFNEPAYASFGRTQNYNAPVSESAAFAYTTALNHLLAKNSRQRLQVGDATVVFWSGRKSSELEAAFASLLGLPSKDDPDAETQAVAWLYASPHTGHLPQEGDTPFYVLGLAPNAARLSVRFWHVDTVSGLSARLRQHFDDLDIVWGPKDHGCRALMPLLCDLVLQGKADNIPPNLAGNVMRAVLSSGPYPATLLPMAVRRIRADKEYGVTRMRAAVLKAVLNRANRCSSAVSKEITVSLDPANPCPGYRLGRLFAVLEKIQEDAQPGINATIRDRFYGAASSSPASVFPQLLKLKNHHLAKLENPAFRRSHEIRLTEIFDGLADMPAHLRLEEQARFAIGYYHQRQALFTKTAKPETTQA